MGFFMSNTHSVYLDVRMATFKGEPCRILSEFDIRNNSIMVSQLLPFRPSNDDSKLTPEQIELKKSIQRLSIIITDCPDAFPDYNIAFDSNEHLEFAARAYLNFKNQNVLRINAEIQGRANVEQVLDAKKLELGKGIIYQLDPQQTNNVHIAILGLCYGAKKAMGSAAMLNIMESSEEGEAFDESVMPFTI